VRPLAACNDVATVNRARFPVCSTSFSTLLVYVVSFSENQTVLLAARIENKLMQVIPVTVVGWLAIIRREGFVQHVRGACSAVVLQS
jgi:hypothetical protein